MASKIARHISMLLLAHNLVNIFRSNETGEIVDRVLQGHTISKKEVARLQENERLLSSAIDANNGLLRTNSELKTEVEKYKEALQVLAHDHVNLMVDYLGQVNATKVVYIANDFSWDSNQFIKKEQDSEPLIPPPCLKPLDAIKWSEQTMFASEVR